MPILPRPRRRPSLEILEGRALMAGLYGTLDPAFGVGGSETVLSDANEPTVGYVMLPHVASQADGKILLAVQKTTGTTESVLVTRLEADGSVDTSFGTAGQVDLAAAGAVSDVEVQPDGKILIAGSAPAAGGQTPAAVAIRLDASGQLDASFGAAGVVSLPAATQLSAVAVQADGKIVLAGTFSDQVSGQFQSDLAAIRLDADGTLDASFGNQGEVTVPFLEDGGLDPTSSDAAASGVAIQADGKIVLAGTASVVPVSFPENLAVEQLGVVARLDADGTLDTTFGFAATGRVILNGAATGGAVQAGAVVVQPDGKIVVGELAHLTAAVGSNIYTNTFIVERLDAEGMSDTGFGGVEGPAVVSVVATAGDVSYNQGPALALQPDGGLLVGFPGGPNGGTIEVARLNTVGALDPEFGGTDGPGIASTPIVSALNSSSGLALQPDGAVVVVGAEYPTVNGVDLETIVAARLQVVAPPTPANQQAPDDFEGDGKSDLAIYLPSIGSFAYRPSTGGPDVFVPFGLAGAGETLPAIGDYTGAGHAEIGAYLPSLALYAYRPAGGGPDVVEPFGIPGVNQDIPVPGDYTGTGKDDLAIYLPSVGELAIRPANGGPDEIIPFGLAGAGQSIPVPGDYDGSGRTEIAVYMPSLSEFAYRPADGGPDVIVPFGDGYGTIPAPGDYDGSGKTEIAAYLTDLGIFAYRPAGGGPDVLTPFGTPRNGDVPVPGDYDGSGHDEIAIFDPNTAVFAYRPPSGPDVLAQFGVAGYGQSIPVAAPAMPIVLATPATASPASSRSVVVKASATSSTTVARAVPSGPAILTLRATRTVVAQAPADAVGGVA